MAGFKQHAREDWISEMPQNLCTTVTEKERLLFKWYFTLTSVRILTLYMYCIFFFVGQCCTTQDTQIPPNQYPTTNWFLEQVVKRESKKQKLAVGRVGRQNKQDSGSQSPGLLSLFSNPTHYYCFPTLSTYNLKIILSKQWFFSMHCSNELLTVVHKVSSLVCLLQLTPFHLHDIQGHQPKVQTFMWQRFMIPTHLL